MIPFANLHESEPSATTSTDFNGYVNGNSSGTYIQKYSLEREDGGMSPVDVAMVLLELVGGKQKLGGDSGGGGTGTRGLHTAWMHVDRDRVLNAARQSAKRWDVDRRSNRGEVVSDEEGVRWIALGQGRKGCLDGVFIGVKDEVGIFLASPHSHVIQLTGIGAYCVRRSLLNTTRLPMAQADRTVSPRIQILGLSRSSSIMEQLC